MRSSGARTYAEIALLILSRALPIEPMERSLKVSAQTGILTRQRQDTLTELLGESEIHQKLPERTWVSHFGSNSSVRLHIAST